MKKILTDLHHGGLFYSFHLLFEKRLGYELYRPIGYEWFNQGFFKIAEPYGNAQDTIDQYLKIDNRAWDAYKNLNGNYRLKDEVYHIFDEENRFQHKAITFNKFKAMDFDLIVSSHPAHENWEQLLQYQPHAKFLVQIGNEGQTAKTKNILCSTADFQEQAGQNVMYYHQEMDLSEYYYKPPTNRNVIKSFVVSLPEPEVYTRYKEALPEFEFAAHGVGSPDGTVHGGKIPQMMRESAFGFHNKKADGFGHVIHQWFASGRPVIVNYDDYKDKVAGPLLIPDVTCISLNQPFDEVCRKIRFFSQPVEHDKMCKAVVKRFKEVVDFDDEAREIKLWLEGLSS